MIGLWLVPAALAVAPERVSESLVDYALAVCEAETAEVSWLGLAQPPPGSAAAQLEWSGDPCRSRPDLRLRVVEGGQLLSTVSVRPGLDVRVRVPVAPGRIEAGQDFTPESGLARVETVRGTPVGEGTWRSRVTLKPGQAVTSNLVTRVPDVARGTDVTLTVVRGTLRIDAPGRLAEDGFVGEPVRVVNDASKVVTEGVLVAPDRVRLL